MQTNQLTQSAAREAVDVSIARFPPRTSRCCGRPSRPTGNTSLNRPDKSPVRTR